MLKDKRVWTEVIPESRHTEPEEFRTLLRYKDIGKIILVTDSVRALYPASARKGSIYRLKDGTIAGSALTMVGAVKNAVKYYSLPLVTAVRMATLNPARLLNIKYKKGLIAAGMDADLLIFDKDFNVKMALVRGKIVYQRGM
jgi:N-acetylglucosamine-6-phosphate deacetylase